MTKDQQAALEQAARIFIDSLDRDYTNPDGSWRDYQETVQFAAQFLAAQRAAVLEEVIKEIENTRAVVAGSTLPLSSVLADIIRWLNELTQEQRP